MSSLAINFTFFFLLAVVILGISFHFTPLLHAKHDNKSVYTGFVHRGKREDTQGFVHGQTQLHEKIFQSPNSTCSYKSMSLPCLSFAKYRTFDGSCNNMENPWWGTTNIPFRRLVQANYADGYFLPRSKSITGLPLPTPREISNICSKTVDNSTEPQANALFTIFAQFIDHDLSSTANGKDDDGHSIHCQCHENISNPFCMNIPTPDMPDQSCILFPRSSDFYQRELACDLSIESSYVVREQVNQINSYLDASMIYGSSKVKSDHLRLFEKGRLKTTDHVLPPQAHAEKEGGACLGAKQERGCFVCGDSRANENMALTSIHTIFIRLHNQLAMNLSEINPHWSDDLIYYETRHIVSALLQHITYEEFLPLLIGRRLSNFGPYQYNSSIDATISNEFATAAFRFGHTLVNSYLRRYNGRFKLLEEIPLDHIMFSPIEAYNQQMGGLDSLLIGLLLTPTLKFNPMFNDLLRNHLFERTKKDLPVETKRLDLSAININRGRDHGLPTYNAMREFCGLRRASSFRDLEDTIDRSVISKLSSAYADVEDIDLYLGGISERSLRDGVVGPTFACIIAQQFNDLRRGDRFFYTTSTVPLKFSPEQLNEIRRVTLSSIICQTVEGLNIIPKNALRLGNRHHNPFISCSSLPPFNLSSWRE